jgi:predicted nucleic-acid-binding Zn-ribbon protein
MTDFIIVQPNYPAEAKCPKCGNTKNIRSGGPSGNGHSKYDVMSDTFGVCYCPACGQRAGWIEFHKPKKAASKQ